MSQAAGAGNPRSVESGLSASAGAAGRRIPGKALFFQLSRQEPAVASPCQTWLFQLSAGATPQSYY